MDRGGRPSSPGCSAGGLPPLRERSRGLLADHLVDFLTTYADLVSCSWQTGAVERNEADSLLAVARSRNPDAEPVFTCALALRMTSQEMIDRRQRLRVEESEVEQRVEIHKVVGMGVRDEHRRHRLADMRC